MGADPSSSAKAAAGPPPSDRPSGVQAQHRRWLDQGQWRIQCCEACTRHVYYPREVCPHCGAARLRWVAPAGNGTVVAVTTVARPAADGGDHDVVLVDLDEGVRLMARVEGVAAGSVAIGQRVQGRVRVIDGVGLVVFDASPAGAAATGSTA